MNALLHYGTPADQYVPNYGERRLFSENEKKITTQLPKNIALIRIATTAAITALLAVKLQATIFCWPVVVIGAAFSGWTAYSHLLSKDPLTEVFYRIVGGKDRFEQLPEIRLEQDPNETLCTAIGKLRWDNLDHPIYKTTALDGRNVVVVKGFSRTPQGLLGAQAKSILVFVEKVGPDDVYRNISNQQALVDAAIHAIFTPLKGNTFGRSLASVESANIWVNGDRVIDCYDSEIFSSITPSMANEFFAQLAVRESVL